MNDNSPYYRRTWVAFAGKMRSGKDTSANYLRNWLIENGVPSGSIFVLRFAEDLKQEYCRLMNISMAQLEDYKEVHRSGLITLASVRREERADYWICKLVARYNNLPPIDSWVLTPDMRFRNEAEFVHKIGGHLFRICRVDERPQKKKGGLMENVSEVDLDGWTQWHAKIVNDSNAPELGYKVRLAAEKMLKKFLPTTKVT